MKPSFPGSLSGIYKFYLGLKKNKVKHSLKQVKDDLLKEWTFTRHRPVRVHFQTNKVLVPGIDHTWQIDLVDMQKFAKYNDNARYILTCIDVFSKYAWAIAIKTKKADDVLFAFQQVLKSGRKPKKIQADKGSEFFNTKFRDLLGKNSILLYSTHSDKKASVVERFNRTLKERMWRYFSSNDKNERYVEIIPDIVSSYNNTYHASIKMTPNEVDEKNSELVFENIYGYSKAYGDDSFINPLFSKGDLVRIAKEKKAFDKGYTPNWTSEPFKINKVFPTNPPLYQILDHNNNVIAGRFYEQELLKISPNEYPKGTYPIEILEEKKNKKGIVTSVKVRWLGYGEEFDSWISPSQIE